MNKIQWKMNLLKDYYCYYRTCYSNNDFFYVCYAFYICANVQNSTCTIAPHSNHSLANADLHFHFHADAVNKMNDHYEYNVRKKKEVVA